MKYANVLPPDRKQLLICRHAKSSWDDAAMSDVERLRESEEALWEELPVLPLSAQPRIFVIHESVGNVVVHTGLAGIGWNMDRWQVASEDTSNDDDVAATETEQVQ